MAVNVNDFRFSIFINNDNAKKALIDLESEVDRLKGNMRSLEKEGKKDSDAYRSFGAALKEAETKMSGLRKEAGLQALSLKELKSLKMQLNNEFARAIPGTDKRKKLEAELNAVNARLRDVNINAGQVGKKLTFGGIAEGFNKYFGVITAGIASFTGVAFGIKKAVDAFNEFESKVAELSALTGLAGDDLNWLSDKAKELSVSVTDAGVRITSSSVDILDGFKLMGSARPELLKNKEALAQVTEGALVLAEAAKIDMQSAVDAVAASMNQFNLDASQTNRVINSIAAGALEGSAEIADLTESMGNVGTVAAQSNMSLEQTVAALEVLSAKQLKGAEAGTQLRGALLNMKQAQVGYQSGTFNLRDALEEVNGKLANMGSDMERDALLQKIFGDRNITVGNILLQNVDTYDKLTTAVTGTNVATEQAAKNTDTNAAKLAQAKNRAHEVAVELGEKLAPAMTSVTGWGTKFLKILISLINFYKEHSRIINTVVVALATYTAISKASIVIDKLKVFWTDKIIKSLNTLFAAMRANPYAAAAAALAAIISYFIIWREKIKEVDETQKDINRSYGEAAAKVSEQKTRIESLIAIINNENVSLANKKKALKAINDISPEYLGNITLEEIKTGKAKKAIDDYIISLDKKMKAEALLDLKRKKMERLSDIMVTKGDEQELNFFESWQAKIAGFFQGSETQKEIEEFYKIGKNIDEVQKLSKAIEELDKQYKEFITSNPDVVGTIINGDGTQNPFSGIGNKPNPNKDAEDKIKAELEYQKKKAQIEEDIWMMTQEGEDKELAETMQFYDKQIETALEYGVDITKLVELRDKAVAAVHKKYHDKEILDKQEAEMKKMELENQSIEQRLAMERDFYERKKQLLVNSFNTELDLTNSLSGIVSNLKNIELEKAGDNEKKKKEINKKYADIEMGITISKIIAETALAAMKAWGTSTIVGGIMSGIIIGEGATQVGMAVAERNRIKGLEKGLYPSYMTATRAQDGKKFRSKISNDTSTRMINEPTILVGEQGKKGLPELIIDGQTLKRLEINAPMAIQAIAHEAGKTHGFEKGFYDNLKNIGQRSSRELEILSRFTGIMEQAVNNGLYTNLPIYDLEKAQNKYNEAKQAFN